MGESTKFDLTVAAETSLDWRRQTYPEGTSDQPGDQAVFLGSTSVAGAIYFPTIGDEIDISANLKFLGGWGSNSDTPITRSSRLFGHFDRLDYAWSRLNILKDHLGVYEAYLSTTFKTPRLTFFAGIYPQDSKVYPNHLNTAPCTAGKDTWSCYISRGNSPDNTVWTDLFTAHIGPGAGFVWEPPVLKGLQLTFTANTGIPPQNATSDDLDAPFGKRWIFTPQALWSRAYEINGLQASSLGSIFYSRDIPANSLNDKGEFLSPTDCVGFYLRQEFGDLQAVLAYGFNRNQISSPRLAVANSTQSINAGLRYLLFKNRFILNGTFSWIGFSTEEKSQLVENKTKGNEYAAETSATVAIYDGLALSAGWRFFTADSNAQAVMGGASSSSSLYVFGTYTKTFSWGGGK